MKFPKNPRRAKLLNRSRAGNVLMFLFLAGFAVYSALPILLIFLQSVKPLNELFIYPPRFFVMNPTFDNFRQLSSLMSSTWVPFIRYIFNSVFVSVTGTVGHIVVASMCAYPLAKMNLKGGNVIFTIIVTSLMFAPTVSDIINYQTISTLGMLDNYLAIILPALGTSLGLYIMKQFMSQIPDALIESAHIDGASTFTVFWKIVMPNMKAPLMTMIVFAFSAMWSRSDATLIYSEELKSLPTLLSQLSSAGIARAGMAAASTVLLMIPPIIVFILTQSQVIEAMTNSGIKE